MGSHLPLLATALFTSLWLTPSLSWADNPIVRHIYTADPAPVVYGDTVYLCTSHDEDVTIDNFFTMNDWRVFSSKDMVNWTDHGSPLSYQSFSWATGKAWAPHCVERDGKYYFYVPVSNAIGVAVADSPIGPFEDAIGRPLVSDYRFIDPSVFVDDDDQAYLYFGNPNLWHVTLEQNMTSYSGQVEQVPMTAESFGQRNGDAERATLYEEGPWFFKRNGLYYMMFAMGPLPERIGYSTAPGPLGPFTYQGVIMESEPGHAFTNHAGVVDFKGRSYFFYHTQELPGGNGYKRSVAVEEFTYNADGSFPTIRKTDEGVSESVAPLDPYTRVEGETMASSEGVEVEDCSAGGRNLANLENGDSIKVESVDFAGGTRSFEASVASAGEGGQIELRLDSPSGTLLGTCSVPTTGGWQNWQEVSCEVTDVTGQHDLFLVFTGGGGSLFNLDYWRFVPTTPLGGEGGASGLGGGFGLSGDTGQAGQGDGGSSAGELGGAGGMLGQGGVVASGGALGEGGVVAAGGRSEGGANSEGGTPGFGGALGLGGTLGQGGADLGVGGSLGSGGRLGLGGAMAAGGGVGLGGVSGSGGHLGQGGLGPATGGSGLAASGTAGQQVGPTTGGAAGALGGQGTLAGATASETVGSGYGSSESGCQCNVPQRGNANGVPLLLASLVPFVRRRSRSSPGRSSTISPIHGATNRLLG